MAGVGSIPPVASGTSLAIPSPRSKGGKGSGKYIQAQAQAPMVESRRLDEIENKLTALVESVRSNEREYGRITTALRSEMISIKNMSDQRYNALDAHSKAIEQQLMRAREANIAHVREMLMQQQETLTKVFTNQQECSNRVENLELWRRQISGEDVSQQLQALSGKLQESKALMTPTMPPMTDHSHVMPGSPSNQTQTNHFVGRELLTTESKPLPAKIVAANCDLPEEQLLRALEAASEAGARQAMDSLSDLTVAQQMFQIKLKEYEKRLIGMEEKIGVLGPDFNFESQTLNGVARNFKFCC